MGHVYLYTHVQTCSTDLAQVIGDRAQKKVTFHPISREHATLSYSTQLTHSLTHSLTPHITLE